MCSGSEAGSYLRLIDMCSGSEAGSYLRLIDMCSGSEAGTYLRLIDFVHHSTLGSLAGRTRCSSRRGFTGTRARPNPSGKGWQERLTRSTAISTYAQGQHVLRGVRKASFTALKEASVWSRSHALQLKTRFLEYQEARRTQPVVQL